MIQSRLRVLMTTDAVGGVWRYAMNLCTALPEVDFVVATLGPRPSTQQRAVAAALPNLTLVESDFRLEWAADRVPDRSASRCWLAALARCCEAAIVHINGYSEACCDIDRPVIAVAHSDVVSWWHAVRRAAAPGDWDDYRRDVVAGLSVAARVVAPSRAILNDLWRSYGLLRQDAQVIANGVDLMGHSRGPKRSVIMGAGRIWDAAKNIKLLDELAPYLSWPVEIAGERRHPEHGLAELCHARPLGILDPEQMRRRLAEAAIFAAPALYEPFGLSILEAAASGCALVLGDIASLRENWEGAAVFSPADDIDKWRAALARLIEDRSARERLGQAAFARSKRFSLARMGHRYRALYNALSTASTGCQVA